MMHADMDMALHLDNDLDRTHKHGQKFVVSEIPVQNNYTRNKQGSQLTKSSPEVPLLSELDSEANIPKLLGLRNCRFPVMKPHNIRIY